MSPSARPVSRFAASLILALSALGTGATDAPAAQWPDISLPQLCELSSDIVRGQVLSRESFRTPEGWIFTRYELQVLDRVLPVEQDAPLLTIEQPGGEMDGLRYTVSGIEHFAVGEELVLFVGTAANGRRVALAGPRGALRVVDGELPGLPAAFPDAGTRDPAVLLERVRDIVATSRPQQ